MYSVQLATALLLAEFGIIGVVGQILGRFVSGILGAFLDFGILTIDLVLDKIKEGKKLKDFEKIAEELWQRANKGKKTEAEKQKIREEYLAVLRKIGPVGGGPRP